MNVAPSRISGDDIARVKRQHIMKVLLYTPAEVAMILGCSTRKVIDLVRDGKLLAAGDNPGYRGIRITAASLDKYVESIVIEPEYWQR